jgi:hypothetical protein
MQFAIYALLALAAANLITAGALVYVDNTP